MRLALSFDVPVDPSPQCPFASLPVGISPRWQIPDNQSSNRPHLSSAVVQVRDRQVEVVRLFFETLLLVHQAPTSLC
jgi:hypothetical protein